MTLLEVIAKGAGTNQQPTPSKFPITFNPDLILPNLKPEPENPDNRFSLVEPVNGFQVTGSSSAMADTNSAFFKKLKQSLNAKKPSHTLSSSGFMNMLVPFLERIGSLAGLPADGYGNGEHAGEAYAQSFIQAIGSFLSQDVIGLLIEACASHGIWGVLETLIWNKLVVTQRLQSELLSKLIAKNQSHLVCLCVKSFSDHLNWSDLLSVLKYFLSPTKEARANMASIRKSWEDEALLAVKMAGDKRLPVKKRAMAKEVAILLMVAYDGFLGPELCLHYLLSSTKAADDMVFSGAVSKLNLDEILGLIRYLGKWLSRYERFPEAIPCPEAPSVLNLDACRWIPTVEVVAEALGVVLDEWFSSLVLHSEFHDELRSVEKVLSSLALEGRLCGSVANLIDISKPSETN